MADIKLRDLYTHNIMGDDFFNDSESYMTEIDDDCQGILGGQRADLVCGTKHTCRDTNIVCHLGTNYNQVD